MNLFIGCGRLVKEPELTYSKNDTSMAICRYTIACERQKKKGEDKAEVDFINCVSFGKAGEFAAKYYHKGQRVLVEGRLQIDKKDDKTYPKIVVSNQEFADGFKETQKPQASMDGFMDVEDNADDEIPF